MNLHPHYLELMILRAQIYPPFQSSVFVSIYWIINRILKKYAFQYIAKIEPFEQQSIQLNLSHLSQEALKRQKERCDASIFKYHKLQMSTNQGPSNFNQPQSLVKYSNPVLVSSSGKKQVKDSKINPQNLTNTYTQDILNSILPPRQYTTEKQQLWIQSVSATPATKQDVLDLQQKLDKRLQQRQARETGICPIREELYSQCFDELIRQITINCAERGLLLVRVRDEIRSTIQSYQTLYESSIAFGMRRALQAEQKKKDMENKIGTLKSQTKELEQQVQELEQKIGQMELKDKEQQELDRQTHKNNVQAQKRTNQILKQELQKLLQGPQPAKK